MASLGSLVIELAANTARLQGDLGRGVNMLQGFARGARSALGVFGVGTGAGLFATLARDAIKFGDEIQKGAQRAGIGAGQFSQLAAAAKSVDVEVGSLSKGLRSMQVAISEASSGNKQLQRSFAAIGLSAQELKGLAPDQQLARIADGLLRLGQEDRARVGADLLSKSYAELVPVLAEGSQGIRSLVAAQKELGNTFSDAQIEKLAKADESIKKLSSSFSGLARTLTAAVAPALSGFFDEITEFVNSSNYTKFQKLSEASFFLGNPLLAPLKLLDLEGEARVKELNDKRLKALSRGPGFGAQRLQRPVIPLGTEEDKFTIPSDASLGIVQRGGGFNFVRPEDLENTRGDQFSFTDDLARELETVPKLVEKAMDRSFIVVDTFRDGFKAAFQDMIDTGKFSFSDLTKFIVAELSKRAIFDAIDRIAESFKKIGAGKSGAGGAAGGFFSFIGSLFGFAQGGSFTVGGTGGTDSKLVAFRATPGERVTVSTPGQAGGGIVLNQSIALHGGGGGITRADLAMWGKQISDLTVARIKDDRRRGKP